jgi:hypothetical protein
MHCRSVFPISELFELIPFCLRVASSVFSSGSDMEMDSDASSDLEMPVRPSKSSKAERVSDNDDYSSEPDVENPYPYEGLYKDAADKERCGSLSSNTNIAVCGTR